MRLAIALELSANDFKLPKIELRTTGWVELFVGALGSQAHPPFRTDEAGLATPEKPGDGEPFMPRNTSNAVDVKSVYRPEGKPDIVGTRTENYPWSFVSPITLAGGVRVEAAKRATRPECVPV
jgi:hypothetical protein